MLLQFFFTYDCKGEVLSLADSWQRHDGELSHVFRAKISQRVEVAGGREEILDLAAVYERRGVGPTLRYKS